MVCEGHRAFRVSPTIPRRGDFGGSGIESRVQGSGFRIKGLGFGVLVGRVCGF